MGTVTAIDDYKKKKKKEEEERVAKNKILKATNRNTLGADFLETGDPAMRGSSLDYNKGQDLIAAKGEMEILINNLDRSELNQQGTNNQREVLIKIQKDLEDENYFSAVGKIIREDIQLTNRTLWSFLRLNRVYQGQRTGTTDVMEMPEMRSEFSGKEVEGELMGAYTGPEKNRPAVEMAIRTVSQGESGSTAVGLDDLELAHQLVRNVLKKEFKNKYEDVVSLQGNQHGLSGMEMPGVKDMDPFRGSYSNNEKINKYLRLYEVLTIELFSKQKNTEEKNIALKFEKAGVISSLDKLAAAQDIVISPDMRERFKNKVAKMETAGQLDFFELKIQELLRQIKSEEKNPDEANAEIQKWLDPSVTFSAQELHADKEEKTAQNKSRDEQAIEALRSGKAVSKPIQKPVEPGEYYQKSA